MATDTEKFKQLAAILGTDGALEVWQSAGETQKGAEANGVAFKETTEKEGKKKLPPAFLKNIYEDDEEDEDEEDMPEPPKKSKKKEAEDELDLSNVTMGDLPVSGFAELMGELLENAVTTKEEQLVASYKESNSQALSEVVTALKEIRKEVKTLKASLDELNGHQPTGYRASRDNGNIIEQFKQAGENEKSEADVIDRLLSFS